MSEEGGVVLLSSSKKEREAYENYAGGTMLHRHILEFPIYTILKHAPRCRPVRHFQNHRKT